MTWPRRWRGRPDGIVIPKVEEREPVQLGQRARSPPPKQANGWPAGAIALIVLVETARGIVNLREIAGADPRLQALIFGAEDLAGDIGRRPHPRGLGSLLRPQRGGDPRRRIRSAGHRHGLRRLQGYAAA